MTITIVGPNGVRVTAPAERWLLGLVALLDEHQVARLMELVQARVELVAPTTHEIIVPGIPSLERFGIV